MGLPQQYALRIRRRNAPFPRRRPHEPQPGIDRPKDVWMTGPVGVMAVILLETAVGGAVVLEASGVRGAVRRGFLILMGVTLVLCAAGAWALTAGGAPGSAASRALAALTVVLVAWQALLLVRQERLARIAGTTGAVVGVGALVAFAALPQTASMLGLLELALGALFLGSALYGLLLGHWYLVERRLAKDHMVRGSWWYIAGVVAAVAAVAISARNPVPDVGTTFSPFLAVPGFTVLLAGGLVAICAIIAGFVWKLAQEGGRSIQAATGYFYLAVIMAFAAELSTKLRFFATA